MAGVQINIKDDSSAKQWLQMVQEINTDYHNAMADAGQCLIDMKDFADGTLVDDFVKFGTNMLNAAEKTYQAIESIADTVNNILKFAKNFMNDAVGTIGKLASKVLNS